MTRITIIGIVAVVVGILWFISIFAPTPAFEAVKSNQEDINSIVNDISSDQSNTMHVAGYEIPLVGEILTPILNILALIGAVGALVVHYVIAFFGLTAYIPSEALPAFGIIAIMVLLAIIGFIRLGRD